MNVETREAKIWSSDQLSFSEPVFVPRPDGILEDDGVILFSALDLENDKRVLLVILNAATFDEEASVEFAAVGTVTKDFHGIFTPLDD